MTSQLVQSFLVSLQAIIVFGLFCFLISLIIKRNDFADTEWGLGFIVILLTSLFFNKEYTGQNLIISILVIFWGLRLATHIFLRNIKKAEDERYAIWRRDWGKWFILRSYLQIYLLQGLLAYLISIPIIITNTQPTNEVSWILFLGLITWIIGFLFESVGDLQLKKFILNPKNKGKIMTSGLWKYTRHPNYFGEVTMWWGIFIISVSSGFWWLGIVGPLTISFLIIKVSGIPITEKLFEGRMGWNEYKNKTSAFLPMPPKA